MNGATPMVPIRCGRLNGGGYAKGVWSPILFDHYAKKCGAGSLPALAFSN